MSKANKTPREGKTELGDTEQGSEPRIVNPGFSPDPHPSKPQLTRISHLYTGVEKEPAEGPPDDALAVQAGASSTVAGLPLSSAGRLPFALGRYFGRAFPFSRATLNTLMLLGVALASAIMAPTIARNRQLTLAFYMGFAGLIGVLILLRWPIVGVVGMVVAALVVPYSIGTGTETGINAAAVVLCLLIALWVLEMVSRQRQIRLLASRSVTAALVLCLSALLAFGFGQISWFPTESAPLTAQIGGLMMFLLSAGVFLVVGHQLHTVQELEWMTWIFLAVSALYVIGRFITGINEETIYKYFVRKATLGAMFYVWLAAMGISQVLFNKKLALHWRAAIGVLVLAVFYINMGESRFWLSGWFPMLVGVAVVLLIARPQFGGVIVICGILVVLLNTQIVGGVLAEGDNVYSTETRLEAWRILINLIKVNPLFGIGMANYYWYTPLFDMMGYNISFNSHNNYIDIVAQAGLLGLACFAWFAWEIGKLGLKLKARVPEGFPLAYVYGVLGGLAGTLVAGFLGDWVIPFVYNIGLEGFRASMLGWMFMGGLLVLEKLFVNPTNETSGG